MQPRPSRDPCLASPRRPAAAATPSHVYIPTFLQTCPQARMEASLYPPVAPVLLKYFKSSKNGVVFSFQVFTVIFRLTFKVLTTAFTEPFHQLTYRRPQFATAFVIQSSEYIFVNDLSLCFYGILRYIVTSFKGYC